MDQPLDLALSIIEDRAYLRARHQVQTVQLADLNVSDPMVMLVLETQAEMMALMRQRRIDRD